MPTGTWTSFEHTADIGIEVSAPTLDALFTTAASALFELLIEAGPAPPRRTAIELPIAVHAADASELLIRWLSELLYINETEHLILRRCVLTELLPDRLAGMVTWDPFDPVSHRHRREIKAVTYHQAGIVESREGWRVRVVFDV